MVSFIEVISVVLVWRTLLLMTLALLPLKGMSQQPPARRGSFYDALRDARQVSPNKELLDLVRYQRVRSEIKLSDDDFAKLIENMGEVEAKLRKLADESRESNNSRDEIRDLILELLAPYDKSTLDFLKEKSNFDRLIEIFVQSKSYSAAANLEVATRIGLSGDELTKFRKVYADVRNQVMSENRDVVRRIIMNQQGDVRRELEKVFEKAGQKIDSKLASALNPDQRHALDELKKNVFHDLPKPGSYRGGRGGRSGGQGPPPANRTPGNEPGSSPPPGDKDKCPDNRSNCDNRNNCDHRGNYDCRMGI